MTNPIQKEFEMKDLNQEKSFTALSNAEINEGTSTSIKDQDTMLSMIVLLLSCLALAALAHVLVS
jgi:hypothetical protein